MKLLGTRHTVKLLLFMIFTAPLAFSQEGTITIEGDPRLDKLIAIKKEINRTEPIEKIFRIQIYNGNLEGAKKAQSDFRNQFLGWSCDISFETPNYKVRIGKFRTRIEADRQLIEVKKKYPNAFILIP
ncbi:SPOR domain-containing protein [Leptobacterium sp. I13]|uniref:SPOR domain-containing protein n=1 Tax=Leptobacterium meishanense TaxID=3128904 RepID=UPI0030EC12B0